MKKKEVASPLAKGNTTKYLKPVVKKQSSSSSSGGVVSAPKFRTAVNTARGSGSIPRKSSQENERGTEDTTGQVFSSTRIRKSNIKSSKNLYPASKLSNPSEEEYLNKYESHQDAGDGNGEDIYEEEYRYHKEVHPSYQSIRNDDEISTENVSAAAKHFVKGLKTTSEYFPNPHFISER
jgi:hypothetical protein